MLKEFLRQAENNDMAPDIITFTWKNARGSIPLIRELSHRPMSWQAKRIFDGTAQEN